VWTGVASDNWNLVGHVFAVGGGDFGLVTGLDWRLTWGSGVVERFVMMTEMTRFLGEFDAMERE